MFDPKINLEVCDSLYESNRLEDSLSSLHQNLKVFSHTQAQKVLNRLNVVSTQILIYFSHEFRTQPLISFQITKNIHDSLSDATAPAVHRLINKMTADKARQPKYVKPECDVVSFWKRR